MDDEEIKSELTDLQAKIAFLEVANDELEQVLLSQHKRLEQVEVTLNELRIASRSKPPSSSIWGTPMRSQPPHITKARPNH
jgi:uncharacterized coiled-coil protein SlyX